MFYRNLMLYRFTPEISAELATLEDALGSHRLRPCGPLEMGTIGFVPPIGRGDEAALTHEVQSAMQFCVGAEDKLLPAVVIHDELARKVEKIAEEEGRKVGSRERKRLKDDLLHELLPRAFVRGSRLYGYADRKDGWLVLNTATRKAGEEAITQIREALGSFPVVPLAPADSPRILMTDWLATGVLPAGLTLGDECELRDPATTTGAIARCSRQDLESEETREHLRNGKQVFKLGLVFDERLSFVLGDDLVVRKLKFLDVVLDELGDSDDAAAEADSRFSLMSLELRRFLSKLDEWFGLAIDAPLHLQRQDAPAHMREVGRQYNTNGAQVTLQDKDGNVIADLSNTTQLVRASSKRIAAPPKRSPRHPAPS